MTRICIDPGHGGPIHPGACYYGRKEKDAALDISLHVASMLKEKGIDIVLTRKTDVDVTLQRRCEICNKERCDAFITIHLNACKDPTVHGAETYKWPACSKPEIAENIQKELVKATGFKDRGVKTSSVYYVLRHTKAPAFVVECGFISYPKECEKLFDPDFQKKVASAIACGIIQSFPK